MCKNIPRGQKEIQNTRDEFNSKIGFTLACIGSAVGMGNIWLFPYRVGKCGGGAFLVLYIVFLALLGFSGVIGEMAFGRAMRTGPLGAFKKALEMRDMKNGELLGMIPLIGCLLIAIGYSVVVGWVIRYLVGSITNSVLNEDPCLYFQKITGNFSSIPWHLIALVSTFAIMVLGISNGIEKLNKIVVPLFFLLFAFLAVLMLFMPSSYKGYEYLFYPEWPSFLNFKTWISALGQAFFSLSLAGSGTIIYGSYLSDKEDVVSCAKSVTIFSFISAMLSSAVIIPAVFSFGLENELQSGPPLMFITMPVIFKSLPMGNYISIIFFAAAWFAAVTSLVNLFEAPIEMLQTKFNFSRGLSVCIIAFISTAVGVFIENAEVVGEWMDILSDYIVPLGALLAGIMFFWVCGKEFAREKVQIGRKKKLGKWFEMMTRYVFIILVFIVYIFNIISKV